MKFLKKSLSALLILVLLLGFAVPAGAEGAENTPAAEAEQSEGMAAVVDELREKYGLYESNFSLCCRNAVTGEEYRYNDEKFMVAASTYKLPLNLYYYEMEQAGEISSDMRIAGMSLHDAHYQSLVWSNNDVSIELLYNLGNFRTYKNKMRKYFTMDDDAITADYYADNNYCTSMMLDTLQYIYDRQDQLTEMIGFMKEAQPGKYFDRYVEDYEVAHKYGFWAQRATTSSPPPGALAV